MTLTPVAPEQSAGAVAAAADSGLTSFSLEDRYRGQSGPIYLTGIQALVRLVLQNARRERQAGRATASLVSGYEGSPLAGYDLELARQKALLAEYDIVHQPAINEELAATALAGTQLIGSIAAPDPVDPGPAGERRGVTAFWYGKAPGLDRSTDALRHANLMGTDPLGGAVAIVGDDPAAKSSSVPCSSEFALADLAMTTFAPADPGEIVEFGLHAIEASRASGVWSALKVPTVIADGASSALAGAPWTPPDLTDLPAGLRPYSHRPSAHLLGAVLADLERSFEDQRLPMAVEYVRRSGLNRVIGDAAAKVGIVCAGATYLVVRQALEILGLDEQRLTDAGVRILKLGVVCPVEPTIVREFAEGLDTIIVVEEKRAFIEDAVKSVLYGSAGAPVVIGKRTAEGRPLFRAWGELDVDAVIGGLLRALRVHGIDGLSEPPRPRTQLPLASASARTPFFCSGCPHNSSTEVAPGTLVGAGIGCHVMVILMPGERAGTITGLTQMGGEGAQWIGLAPFVPQHHFVQNLGDGTFSHSGSLAVRAAVGAKVNITYKLLRNSAVAMTGGQHPLGELSLPQLITLLEAEGVSRVVVTSDRPDEVRRQLHRGPRAQRRVEVRHRDDILDVQRELAAIEGVTVLIHDQECAAAKRRQRRRGTAATPTERVLINERVCEGCGDCGATSNCLSVEPVDTEFGRKTRINQSSCNIDLSCLSGDCPAFVTVTPAGPVRSAKPTSRSVTAPQEPERIARADGFAMRITGIGGTGVVTVSQVLATAAAIDGLQVRALDQTGLAQKGGAVVSDLTFARDQHLRSPKLAAGECDLYLGCDALVATDPTNLRTASPERTTAVISTSPVPTGEMVIDTEVHYPAREQVIATLHGGVARSHFLDANALALAWLGDAQYANMILVGAAYQAGALPLAAAAIERAIELNGVAVEVNIAAFRRGRLAISEATVEPALTPAAPAAESLEAVVARRSTELTAYQNGKYAQEFTAFVAQVQAREAQVSDDTLLSTAVARNLYKLMAYKDEYEVARLSLAPSLADDVQSQFGAGAHVKYQLHPPVLRALGRKHKIAFGPWFRNAFALLEVGRHLRGTALDPFGYAGVRRVERALIPEYRATVTTLLDGLTAANLDQAVAIAELPDMVRGYENLKLRNVERYHARMAELLGDFIRAEARHTWTTPKPECSTKTSKSESWVTTGTSRASAVAAIHMSLTLARRRAVANRTRIRAHASATVASIGTGFIATTAFRVDRRRERVSTSVAASTPAVSSACVITDTASSDGSRESFNPRDSRAMKTDVSRSPRVTRSGPGPR